MKTFLKVLKFLVEIVVLLVAGFIMLYITYYFGWPMLPEGMTFGNDIPSAMNNVFYLEHWYPPMPKWIHLWSGGISFLQVYPILPFVTTFFVHKLWGFSIFKAMKLVMFFSLPFAATGVAALGRVLTKNWWVALLAGILMLISPDSWLQITFGGFYAIAFSAPFFAWTLVFFCLAMEKENFWLSVSAAVFYGVTWLAHPTAGTLATVVMGILGFGYGVKLYGWKGSWKGLLRTLFIGLLGGMLFAWWIFPFFTREDVGGISLGVEQMYRTTIREIVGLDIPEDVVYITSTFFAASAIILFVLGSIVVFFRKSILRWAVLACALALFIMTAGHYAKPVVKMFNLFWTATNVRAGLILRILGPIIGAYGAVSLTRPFFWLIEKLAKGLKEKTWWFYITGTIGGIVGFIVFLFILKNVVIIPPFEGEGDFSLAYHGYGPLRNWFVVKEIDGKPTAVVSPNRQPQGVPLFKEPKTILSELPEIISLTSGESNSAFEENLKAMIRVSGVTAKQRIDTSAMGGTLIGMLNNYSQVGQVQGYANTTLIQRMIGWQIDCTFISDTCGSRQVADLNHWFGVSQTWYGGGELVTVEKDLPKFDDPEIFEAEQVYLGNFDAKDNYLKIYRLKEETGLASISNKPTILVIGDNPPNNDVFDIVFRGLSKVDFGYKDAWSVKGKRVIDAYKLEELSQFEAIILHGYQYHNRNKAWELLKEYVNGGGKLFVDTGWKYMNSDWGKEEKGQIVAIPMPEILPVEKTIWGEIRDGWDLELPSHQITEGVGVTDWGEPLWRGRPWGVAVAEKDWLRSGASPLLVNQGKVLAAAWNYGQGKVVWTGFDFWGHLVESRGNDEIEFVRRVMAWLVGGDYWENFLDFERVTPDLIKINFTQGAGNNKQSLLLRNKLMFKEVASDNWAVAEIEKQKLPVYKAGPGFKMVFLPAETTSGQIVFSYRRNKTQILGLITSILAIVLLISYVVSKFVKKDWDKKLAQKIKDNFQHRARKAKESWEREDE